MQLTLNNYILLFCGSCITALMVYYAGVNGPGTTHDSFNYLHAGFSLYESGELRRPDNSIYMEWPPLYPAIIAAIYGITGSLINGVLFFQIFVVALSVLIGGLLIIKFIQNKILFWIAYISIVFSAPLILINHFIWSESFFTLLLLSHLYILFYYLKYQSSRLWVRLIIIGILLCLQRHVGLFLVFGTMIVLWQNHKDKGLKGSFYHSLSYGFLCVLPLIFWWIRNYFSEGQIINDYSSTMFTSDVIVHGLNFLNVLTSWFLPNEISTLLRAFLLLIIIGFLIKKFNHNNLLRGRKTEIIKAYLNIFLVYFFLTYLASLIVNEYIDDRLLAPVYIPGMIIFFFYFDQYIINLASAKEKNLIFWVCFLWMFYPLSRSIFNTHVWHNQILVVPKSQFQNPEFIKLLTLIL